MAGKTVAVVPAAGQGRRLGAEQAKQYLDLGGRPLLSRTLEAMEAAPQVEAVVVAAPPGHQEQTWERCIRPYGLGKVARVVEGGQHRQDSVAAGCRAAAELGAQWVLVHDAARPLARPELFGRVLAAAQEHGAAAAGWPAADTLKRADQQGRVLETLERQGIWLVQTPQAFELELLARAQAQAAAEGFLATDEAGLVERYGGEVRMVKGQADNLKITTAQDLAMARSLAGGGLPRVGQGLDAHRLVAGRPLVLAGVRLDYALGLEGHSDADVICHAVMDALLAAAGLGDIGGMFPDSDPAYRDAESLGLLGQVVQRLAQEGLRPHQVSVTLLAQEPRIAPHAPQMRRNLAQALRLEPGMVNLAATTSEGLGFAGRGEGMAALATAVIGPLDNAP